MSKLDPWRNGLEYPKGEDGDKLLAGNFDEIAKNFDKTGLYLREKKEFSALQVISSTSYVDVSESKVSTTITGGLVAIHASIVNIGNNNVCKFRLMNGDTELADCTFNYNGINAGGSLSIFWAGNVSGGQNVFTVQGKASANTARVNDGGKSAIFILEYVKG
jgi:hypothetical protein